MANGRDSVAARGTDPRGGHVRLYWEILDSNAWRSLSATDQRAYIAMQRQLRSTNNGDLSLPLSVVRHFGIASSATLAKNLRALLAVGLLAITRKGGCTRGGQRLPSLYRFTDHPAYANPMKYIEAAPATNEWRTVKSLAMGRALIRNAEDHAAKVQLQRLAATASKNEVVGVLTASIREVWTPFPTSNVEAGSNRKTGRKPNSHAGSPKSPASARSENHTSQTEVLSTVAIPMGRFPAIKGAELSTAEGGACDEPTDAVGNSVLAHKRISYTTH